MNNPSTREQIYLNNLFFMMNEACQQTETEDGEVAKGLSMDRILHWRTKLIADLEAWDAQFVPEE